MAAVNVILVCGHECPDPAYLQTVSPDWTVVAGGRALTAAIDTARAASADPVCVVPMTLGRDPGLVADAARALSWARRESNSPPLVLSSPLGTADHLVGWLRGRAAAASSDALLVVAPTGSPFEDAELFRIARLVRQFGPRRWWRWLCRAGTPTSTTVSTDVVDWVPGRSPSCRRGSARGRRFRPGSPTAAHY